MSYNWSISLALYKRDMDDLIDNHFLKISEEDCLYHQNFVRIDIPRGDDYYDAAVICIHTMNFDVFDDLSIYVHKNNIPYAVVKLGEEIDDVYYSYEMRNDKNEVDEFFPDVFNIRREILIFDNSGEPVYCNSFDDSESYVECDERLVTSSIDLYKE